MTRILPNFAEQGADVGPHPGVKGAVGGCVTGGAPARIPAGTAPAGGPAPSPRPAGWVSSGPSPRPPFSTPETAPRSPASLSEGAGSVRARRGRDKHAPEILERKHPPWQRERGKWSARVPGFPPAPPAAARVSPPPLLGSCLPGHGVCPSVCPPRPTTPSPSRSFAGRRAGSAAREGPGPPAAALRVPAAATCGARPPAL
nr:PREDICTED: basic proline-rich protein-like [Equus przewalskii]XP_023484370.1 basic proline-rich protein-like [Equus caballus]